MTERPYMKLWIADYLGDTQHLTIEQSGCYLHLLMAMWRAGGYLPNDPKKLARVVRLTVGKWTKIASDLMPLFTVEGDKITQKRLQIELKEAREFSDKQRDNAFAKHRKDKAKADASAHAKRVPNACQTDATIAIATVKEENKRTPFGVFREVMDEEHAKAVVEHRKKKRASSAVKAAELIAKEFAKCADPNAAAELMIRRDWRGFEAEWFEGKSGQTGPPAGQFWRPNGDGGYVRHGGREFEAWAEWAEKDNKDNTLAYELKRARRTGEEVRVKKRFPSFQ